MLRVAVSGYYGFNNTGDEAILLALVSTLKALAPGTEITVLSHCPVETRSSRGVKSVNRWNPLAVLWTLIRSDLLISGGGGLLQDVTGIRSICYYLGVVLLAKLLGKPVMYYAQGVGPVRTRFGRWLTRVVSNRVDLITVRDQSSKDDFLAMGVNRPPLVVTADPVLALSGAQFSLEAGEALLAGICGKKDVEKDDTGEKGDGSGSAGCLGIIIRDWQDCGRFKKEVAAAADMLAREGWKIILIPFHFPMDLQACRDVADMMQEPGHLVQQKLSVEALFSLLGKLDLVLGMRLHSLIMASIMRTPCVGISYDPKVDRFLEITGQPVAGTVHDLDRDRLYRELVSTWERRQEIVSHLDQVLANLRQQAWETASLTLSVFFARSPRRRREMGIPSRRGVGHFLRKGKGRRSSQRDMSGNP